MLSAPVLFLLLVGAQPCDPGEPPGVRDELDVCAERIEVLKSRQQTGRQLDRLLRRAQELAAELERTRAELPASPYAPSPEELRERADAAHDEADRLAAEIALLDVRIQDIRRRRELGSSIARANLGGPGVIVDPAQALVARRATLAERRARYLADASRLEHDARAAEKDR
jgi:hypothetical protein